MTLQLTQEISPLQILNAAAQTIEQTWWFTQQNCGFHQQKLECHKEHICLTIKYCCFLMAYLGDITK